MKVKQEMVTAIGAAAGKAAPPVGVTVAAATGKIDLTAGVAIVTIGYVLIQSAYLVWKWYREWRRGDKG